MFIPAKIKNRVKKQGGAAVLLLRTNNTITWAYGHINDGLVHVELNRQAYEFDRVFLYKKIPVIVILEWRIIGVGGVVEKEFFAQVAGDNHEEFTQVNELYNRGQQTIIRAVEQSNVDEAKKKVGGSIIMWILLGVGAIYLVSTMFSGG